eukprot:scaffold86253_cov66-Phaeocystis_antarctica.AAC.4
MQLTSRPAGIDPAAAADDDDERVEGGERRAVPLGVQQRQRRAASWLDEDPVIVEQRRAPGYSMMGVARWVLHDRRGIDDFGRPSRPHHSLPLGPGRLRLLPSAQRSQEPGEPIPGGQGSAL